MAARQYRVTKRTQESKRNVLRRAGRTTNPKFSSLLSRELCLQIEVRLLLSEVQRICFDHYALLIDVNHIVAVLERLGSNLT